MYREKIREYFDEHIDDVIASMREIMRIDSSFQQPCDGMPYGKGSAAALKWGSDFGERLGMSVKNFDNHAISMDFKDGDPTLGILSHLDVVPGCDGWHYPIFDCTVDGENIYGRGAIDDKGPSVAVLYAIKCIKELEIPIKDNFRVVFGGNEEGGCEDIAYYETQEKFPPMVFTPDGTFPVLNCEKGMLHLTFSGVGSMQGGGVEVESLTGGTVINAICDKVELKIKGQSKEQILGVFKELDAGCEIVISGVDTLDITITGRSAHGSRPENGLNAITATLKLLARLGIDKAAAFEKLFPHGEFNGKSAGLGFSDEVSGEMSCALTMLSFDGETTKGGIDIRFPIDKTLSEITGIITDALGSAGMTVDTADGMEPHYVSKDSPLVRKLLEVYKEVVGQEGECIAEGGVTYVHNIDGGVAFGAEFPDEENNMHGADEHISIQTLKYNLNLYTNAIIKICGG